MERKKVTIPDLFRKKEEGQPITMLTAYDYSTAMAVDEAGIDTILVGDSLGMVILGYEGTVPVTMEEMLHHARAVRRGVKYAFLIGDMPFMSYNISLSEAIRNAGRFLKEAGCDAVKLEGGSEVAQTVEAMVRGGISVVGHIGLTPQTATQLGGFRVQGKDAASAGRLITSALDLEKAGICMLVMECIPDRLAAHITRLLKIPTIGIGAGPDCDGQVLVINDLLGLYKKFIPRFVKQYAQLHPLISQAISDYKQEVERKKFPAREHVFPMTEAEIKKITAKSGGKARGPKRKV
jgi:3-methyl-2-oxobutanoate hydroxymethyltransferase